MKICSYSIVLQKVIFIYFLFALIEERKWEASKERRTTKVFCFLRLFRYPLISFPRCVSCLSQDPLVTPWSPATRSFL